MFLTTLLKHRNGKSQSVFGTLDFLVQEPLEIYNANEKDFLSCDQLNDFRSDAFLFHKRRQGLLPEEKPYDQIFDRAALVRILEGRQQYDSQYISGGPVNPKNGERYSNYSIEYRNWAASQKKIVLTDEQAQMIEQIDYSVRAHPHANNLLSDGVAQGVVRTEYQGLLCQTRIDWLSPQHGIVSVVLRSNFIWPESHLRNGIVHRLAFQRDLITEFAAGDIPVHIIVVEKSIPHRCGVWNVCPGLLRRSQKENIAAIERFKRCLQNDHWPSGYEEIRVLKPVGF